MKLFFNEKSNPLFQTIPKNIWVVDLGRIFTGEEA